MVLHKGAWCWQGEAIVMFPALVARLQYKVKEFALRVCTAYFQGSIRALLAFMELTTDQWTDLPETSVPTWAC